ncbi:MAG: hypothetical protein KF691_03480 [Phycisphaeraceae bacterium]|nr:hypothetical protein [Phycisphaeraceae bacterium]
MAALIAGCPARNRTGEGDAMRDVVTIGMSKEAAMKALQSRGIECGYEKENNVIRAIRRNVSRQGMVTKSMSYTFKLDEQGNVSSIEEKEMLTGP